MINTVRIPPSPPYVAGVVVGGQAAKLGAEASGILMQLIEGRVQQSGRDKKAQADAATNRNLANILKKGDSQ